MISVFPSVGTEYFMLQGNLPQNRNNILSLKAVSYTHLRAHETGRNLVCRLLLEKKNISLKNKKKKIMEHIQHRLPP